MVIMEGRKKNYDFDSMIEEQKHIRNSIDNDTKSKKITAILMLVCAQNSSNYNNCTESRKTHAA